MTAIIILVIIIITGHDETASAVAHWIGSAINCIDRLIYGPMAVLGHVQGFRCSLLDPGLVLIWHLNAATCVGRRLLAGRLMSASRVVQVSCFFSFSRFSASARSISHTLLWIGICTRFCYGFPSRTAKWRYVFAASDTPEAGVLRLFAIFRFPCVFRGSVMPTTYWTVSKIIINLKLFQCVKVSIILIMLEFIIGIKLYKNFLNIYILQ